jgi:hypothetical protein
VTSTSRLAQERASQDERTHIIAEMAYRLQASKAVARVVGKTMHGICRTSRHCTGSIRGGKVNECAPECNRNGARPGLATDRHTVLHYSATQGMGPGMKHASTYARS